MDSKKIINILYWTTPILLFLIQFLFTINSINQIRYEELAESIRNPFWLQNHLIYDGTSSNVGWYGTLLAIYNLFGFHFFAAKFFRLFLQFISLFCLAYILQKFLTKKYSFVPLLTIGLSPIMLYYNTLQAQYGIDLQYLPICLFLLVTLNARKTVLFYINQFLFGVIAMIAAMSYPPFIFFSPALITIYLLKLKEQKIKTLGILKNILLTFSSFILPFLLSLLFIENKNIFLSDPITKNGVFRGAGKITFDITIFTKNLSSFISDIIDRGKTYNFDLNNPDFSNFYPILPLLLVLGITIYLLKTRKYKLAIYLSIFTFIFNLLISGFNFDPSGVSGVRRYTPSLAAIYSLFIISWFFVISNKFTDKIKTILITILLLIPIHHLIVLPINFSHLKDPSEFKYGLWFSIAQNPDDSLNLILNSTIKEDLKLSCTDKNGKNSFCRYNEIYAAVAGACYWNKLNCNQIYGYDPITKQYIPISIKLWETYYWPH